MTARARRVYLGLGRAFVALGLGVAAFGLVDAAWGLGVFRASPVGTAAFLAVIGALLLWTVRQAGPATADPDGEPADDPADDALAHLPEPGRDRPPPPADRR